MKIPILGLAMRRAGHIGIERANPREAIRSMNAAAEKVKGGTSVLIFPEGTRSLDGRLQPFKKGGFNMAIKRTAAEIRAKLEKKYSAKIQYYCELKNKVYHGGTMNFTIAEYDAIFNEFRDFHQDMAQGNSKNLLIYRLATSLNEKLCDAMELEEEMPSHIVKKSDVLKHLKILEERERDLTIETNWAFLGYDSPEDAEKNRLPDNWISRVHAVEKRRQELEKLLLTFK